MTEEPKKDKRGGHRPGSGRKPNDPSGKKIPGTWALAPDVYGIITDQDNQPEFIEMLVREYDKAKRESQAV